MTAIRTTSVTIANAGDTTITVNDGVDFSEVVPSSSIQIDGIAANLIVDAGTEPVDGVSTLTLRTGYPAGLALPTAYAATITIGSNAFKNMANQLKTQVDYVADSAKTVSDYGSTNNTSFSWPAIDGSTTTVKTPLALQAEVDTTIANANSLVNSLGLTKQADFERNRIARVMDAQRVGSGFVETGLHNSASIVAGLYTSFAFPKANTIFLGRTRSDGAGIGDSKTEHPVIDVNGVEMHLNHINTASIYHSSELLLPEAVDPIVEATTTTTQDYNQHDCIVQDNDAYFCIADSTAGDLLTDTTKFRHEPDGAVREDLLGMEAFLVPLSGANKRPFYPRGMIQNGESTYEGVTMSATSGLGISGVDAGYTRAGEWDTTTDGLGVDWESLTDTQRETLASKPENNVYVSNGIAYQWHLRYKAYRGFGVGWENTDVLAVGNDKELSFGAEQFVRPQGMVNTQPYEIGTAQGAGNPFYANSNDSVTPASDLQLFQAYDTAVAGSFNYDISVNGECFFIPIALVTRLNKGAYHKFLNEWGTRTTNRTDIYANASWDHVSAYKYASLAECFDIRNGNPANNDDVGAMVDSGSIASGWGSGRPDGAFYDIIEPWQVHSLRLKTHNPEKTVNGSQYDAISNKVRGTQGMPRVYKLLDETITTNGSGVYNIDNGGRILIPTSDSTNPRDTASSIFDHLVQEQITHWILSGDNGEVMKIPRLTRTGNTSLSFWPWSNNTANINGLGNPEIISEFNAKFPSGTVLSLGCEYESSVSVSGEYPTSCYFGAPERLKAAMDNMGADYIYGKWFPPVPDSTNQEFKILSDKVADSSLTNLSTTDDGTTWTPGTALNGDIASSTNSTNQNWSATTLLIINYTTYANGWEPESQSSVDNAELSDVTATNAHHWYWGSVFGSHLFGEVSTGNTAPQIHQGYSVSGYVIEENGQLHEHSTMAPTHETIDLGGTSTGFKCAFYHSTTDNRITFEKSVAKQIKYDSGLDHGSEFENQSESYTGWTLDQYYHVIDGQFEGLWRCTLATTTPLSSSGWFINSDGNIAWENGTVYFEKWDGNGWSDDDQIQVVDGLSIMESESPDIYVQVGHFTRKRPINAI